MNTSATLIVVLLGACTGEAFAQSAPLQKEAFELHANRAWGVAIGSAPGVFGLTLAHQNRNVANVAPATSLGNTMDAKNTLLAANVKAGRVTAYLAYSANRGWGTSPLWNPDSPYSALMASTPTTDSRDVLVGLAMPLGATTLLATAVRKNDRDVSNRDARQLAFGASHALSRHTDFYAAVSRTSYTDPHAPGGNAINLGMRHAF